MSGAGGWIRPPWGQSRWPIETEETGSFFIGSLRKQTFKKSFFIGSLRKQTFKKIKKYKQMYIMIREYSTGGKKKNK